MRNPLLRSLSFLGNALRRTPLARSPLLYRMHSALAFRLNRAQELEWGDFRVRIDRRDRVIGKKLLLYGEYEPHEIRHLCSRVRPGERVLDVGANIGLYTLHLSRAVGPEGRVVAVEPDPDNLALLRHNLSANGCENVEVLACAFGAEEGEADLFQVEDNRGSLSLADVHETGRSIKIMVRRADEALAELDFLPEVAKIDAQGAEPQVLAGLAHRPRLMLLEFAPPFIRALGNDPRTFLEDLDSEGYRLELIDHHDGALRKVSPAEALATVRESRDGNHSLLLTRPPSTLPGDAPSL